MGKDVLHVEIDSEVIKAMEEFRLNELRPYEHKYEFVEKAIKERLGRDKISD